MYAGDMPRVSGEVETAAGASAEELAVALGALFLHVKNHFERVVQPYDLPPPCAKALHLKDSTLTSRSTYATVQQPNTVAVDDSSGELVVTSSLRSGALEFIPQ